MDPFGRLREFLLARAKLPGRRSHAHSILMWFGEAGAGETRAGCS
jgi:hypothetical protein